MRSWAPSLSRTNRSSATGLLVFKTDPSVSSVSAPGMQATHFQSQFKIGGRSIGDGTPVFIVAEAGVSHFGDMDLSRQLVQLAASAKADAFKTQFFDVDA